MMIAGRVLEALRKHGPISRTDLANKMGTPRGSVAPAIDRLIVLGWVERLGPRNNATYHVIRDGEYVDGRGKGPNCARGRAMGPLASRAKKTQPHESPWPMPPVPELERVWPHTFTRLERNLNLCANQGGNVRPQET